MGSRCACALFAIVSCAAAACAPRAPMSVESQARASSPSTVCTFGIRGVRASTNDVRGGVDVTLTTYGRRIGELRTRARSAFDVDESGPRPRSPSADVRLEEIAAGIVLHVHARDPAEVEAVRSDVDSRLERARAEAEGLCR